MNRFSSADVFGVFWAGFFGECISLRDHPVFMYGTLLVLIEYTLFAAICIGGGFKPPQNISICGYLEILPDRFAFLYFHVASSGIDSTLWHAVKVFKLEQHFLLSAVQVALNIGCAATLTGFSIFPRCLWDLHQACVLAWVCLTSAAMIVTFVRDFRKFDFSLIPSAFWTLSITFCCIFYSESTWRFFFYEALSVMSYISWCSSVHRQHSRIFSIFHVIIIDGFLALFIFGLFRFHQQVACSVSAKW